MLLVSFTLSVVWYTYALSFSPIHLTIIENLAVKVLIVVILLHLEDGNFAMLPAETLRNSSVEHPNHFTIDLPTLEQFPFLSLNILTVILLVWCPFKVRCINCAKHRIFHMCMYLTFEAVKSQGYSHTFHTHSLWTVLRRSTHSVEKIQPVIFMLRYICCVCVICQSPPSLPPRSDFSLLCQCLAFLSILPLFARGHKVTSLPHFNRWSLSNCRLYWCNQVTLYLLHSLVVEAALTWHFLRIVGCLMPPYFKFWMIWVWRQWHF